MKSKTSCFNKTIFLKNITRFWPIWALYLVILFFSMPVSLFLRTRQTIYYETGMSPAADRLSNMLECISTNLKPTLPFIFAILCAVAVFSYLYNAKSCNMIHALPVKRGELFLTSYLDGLLFLFVPQIITFLLSLFVCIMNNVTAVEYLFYWLVYTMGMSFFFFSSAVFCCMLTGQYAAGFAYYFLGNTIYAIIKSLISTIVSILCYGMTAASGIFGMTTSKDLFFSPIVYLTNKVDIFWDFDSDFYNITEVTISGGNIIALYCIPAVILIVVSVLFYRKRHLECAGDIVSFFWMKPIFRWLVAFCAGSGLAIVFTQLFFVDTRYAAIVLFICTILFSCICFFLAEMLLKKQFRVFRKKCWIEWGICACATLFILGSINGDLFHVERKVPGVNDTAAAVLSCNYDLVLTDPEDIRELEDIHQTIIDNKTSYKNYYYDHMRMGNTNISTWERTSGFSSDQEITEEMQSGSSLSYITLHYYLKNGREIIRNYYIPTSAEYLSASDSAAGKIRSMQKKSDGYLKYLICENYEDVNYYSGTFSYLEEDNSEEYLDLNEEQVQLLYEAIKKDILSGNYPYLIGDDTMNDGNTYFNSLSLDGKIYGKPVNIYSSLPNSTSAEEQEMFYSSFSPRTSVNEAKYTNVYTPFYITDTCEYTIQALIDLGIIQTQSDLTYQDDYYDILNELYK